ncbi:MFS transporter [Microbulbifer elongatus]|uniref:MFS transporter n=1 Tax=Microbulbifer elongatus TaxID=86173 RepID=A0ABT1NXP1_9GAMM|nr:MFS transporter [Microbulbifer elongatus]MCQ3828656.1 MFS transporter [Microbulbifer elongatus]
MQAASPPSPISSPLASPRVQRNNIWRLAIAQALAGANSVVPYAVGGIVGYTLAPLPVLATLPLTLFVVGMTLCTLPAGAIAGRYGRRTAFLLGSGAGVLAGLVAVAAVMVGGVTGFWLYCLSTLLGGAYAAVVLSFRFAAADGVEPARKAQALSLVMAGGVAAGVVGPQLVNWTMNLLPAPMFVATFYAQAAVAALCAMILLGVRLPRPVHSRGRGGRPMGNILRQPRFIAAIACGAISYTLMNFLMTAAPLAMHMHGHSTESSNLGLQWHVIAMFAPSFFTGKVIARFGAEQVMVVGLLLIGISAAVGLGGMDVSHFWWTLILLGLGWNFGFLGASALVLQCHTEDEKTRVQSVNDFIVFGLMALGSFASGGILSAFGWSAVLWTAFPPLAITLVALVALQMRTRAVGSPSAKG